MVGVVKTWSDAAEIESLFALALCGDGGAPGGASDVSVNADGEGSGSATLPAPAEALRTGEAGGCCGDDDGRATAAGADGAGGCKVVWILRVARCATRRVLTVASALAETRRRCRRLREDEDDDILFLFLLYYICILNFIHKKIQVLILIL